MKLDGIVFVHDDPTMWTHGGGRVVVSLARYVAVLLVYPLGIRALSQQHKGLTLVRALGRYALGSDFDQVEGASLMHIPMIPLSSHFRFISQANMAWLRARIRGAVVRLGWQRFALWFTFPTFGHLIGEIGETICIYHAVDDYTTFPIPDPDRERTRRMEQAVLKRADLAFGVSRVLTEQMRDLGAGERAFYLPNGTNIRRRQPRDCPKPAELAKLKGPLLCYLGSINERVDLVLLKQIMAKQSEWNLVLIGDIKGGQLRPDSPQVKNLFELPNVIWLGSKPNTVVPNYLVWMDVCLIPYAIDFATNHYCFPYKLFDYLAAGRPVVSTPVPAVCDHASWVRIATSPWEFEQQINASLGEGEHQEEARINFSATNTWDDRANVVLSLLEQTVNRRPPDTHGRAH